MAKRLVRGKYPYKDKDSKLDKKLSKKERLRLKRKELMQEDKMIKKQCDCNHLDSKRNETHFKKDKDGVLMTCKICGGQLINDKSLLTKEAVESAVTTLYTVFGLVRNKLNIDEDTDRLITKTLLTISRSPKLLAKIKEANTIRKGSKKKNKDKKKNRRYDRINY